MSGFLYRWSLRSSFNEARALELALTVFSVVQEIRRNNIDSHCWFTLLVKTLRGRVGMSEAMDLATRLTSDDINEEEEVCMEDMVEITMQLDVLSCT
jgi:hypothetical protein